MAKERSTLPFHLESRSWTWSARKVSSLSYLGFLFLLFFSNTHCRKSSPPPNILPPVTQEGKNTFGCKVNGEVWIPYYQCEVINIFSKCKELQTVMTSADTTSKLPIDFELSVSRELTPDGSFSSFIIGARILKTSKFDSFLTVDYRKDSISYSPQYPVSNASNAITLTKLDTVNQIISGTFYFTLYGPYGPTNGDSVVITDGRFDLTYNACLCH